MNELTGYESIRKEVERQMEAKADRRLVVYLYQSESQRQEYVKDIVEYCLHCRVFSPSLDDE